MRNAGRLKLAFYPLPVAAALQLKAHLSFPNEAFSAIDPCLGNGVALSHLVESQQAYTYGIELDANRTLDASSLGITVWHADALEMRCPPGTASLLYLNPPYDFEVGSAGSNKRMEFIFLRHTYSWLKADGVLVFVIPQRRLKECARLLANQFTHLEAYKLQEPECLRFNQIAVFGYRRRVDKRLSDQAQERITRELEATAEKRDLRPLPHVPEFRYQVPASQRLALRHDGIPLDRVEDLLLQSGAYRQLTSVLVQQAEDVRGRPVTPLHGGHVGLLCTAGLLDGVFGQGDERHIARWRSIKYIDHWVDQEEDGGQTIHDCERFSQELTLLYATGQTEILTHEKKKSPC